MHDSHDSPSKHTETAHGLAVFLILSGLVGWLAAFVLTLDKFTQLEDPSAALGCDFSLLVQCGKNLDSVQGAVFGFPNPIIGLACWVAPVIVGMAMLAGARFARWFWVLFWLGYVFAISLVCWLIGQSIFVLGTLCPWCMVTWAMTIPGFLAVTLHVIRIGALPLGATARRVATTLYGWLPILTLAAFVLVALLAQLRLDVIGHL